MTASKKWNGLCSTGKHGLDYQGQPCDLCAKATAPTIADVRAAFQRHHDRLRAELVSAARGVAADLSRLADVVERDDAPPRTPIQHEATSINALCGELNALREVLAVLRGLTP